MILSLLSSNTGPEKSVLQRYPYADLHIPLFLVQGIIGTAYAIAQRYLCSMHDKLHNCRA